MRRSRLLFVVLCTLLLTLALSGIPRPALAAVRAVDGDPSDWTGTASATAHTDAESAQEWIYTGAQGDRRTDTGMTDEADLTEVRLTTDGTYLYFLFRLREITSASEVHIGVGIDTDQVADSGLNFLGDDSGLSFGRPFMRPERVLSFHVAGGNTQAVEWFAGGGWYEPGGSQIAISEANNVVEARVPLTHLQGLNGNSDFILSVATFQNNPNWNNDGDTTDGFGVSDAVDVLGVPGQSGSSWERDLSDGNVYYGWWIQLQGASAAPTAVVWDRLYHSQCDQLLANNCAEDDHPAEQPVPFTGDGFQNQDGTTTFLDLDLWSDDGTVAPGGTTDVYAYDDNSVNVYMLAHKGDLTDDADDPAIRYYAGGEQFTAMSDVADYEGGWNGSAPTTYDVFSGTIPSQAPGDVFYYLRANDENGYRHLCRNSGNNRNWINQWIRKGACDPNTDYAYTVIDDDNTGPTITDVEYDGTQVCATVYDNNTRSGDNDSDVSEVRLRYSTTASDVRNDGGLVTPMVNTTGNRYCGPAAFVLSTYYRVEAINNDTDNARTADRDRNNSSIYCDGTAACSTSGASQDNDIWWSEVRHDTRDGQYRDPFGALSTGMTVTLRLRVADSDLQGVNLHLYNTPSGDETLSMAQDSSIIDPAYDWFEATVPAFHTATPRLLYYKFELIDGTDVDWYVDDYSHNSYDHEDRYENGTGMMVDDGTASQYFNNSFNITVYDSALDATIPDWVQNSVMYQIMPDRFRNGDTANDNAWPYNNVYGTPTYFHTTWNESPIDPRPGGTAGAEGQWSADFFGGDLQGIIEKLDYLESIGVTSLYLNPVFMSPSNHGYDTTDYYQINPRFGNNALFETLADEAEERGITLILDGVFNHTGSDSRYFDRYSRWDANGNASTAADGSGACESASSPYAALYAFSSTSNGPCRNGTANYEAWWGYDSLPLLNENAAVKDLVFDQDNTNLTPGVIQHWYGLGADGWRFDVADEVSHSFWQDFRDAVKDRDNLLGPLYSEVWFEATPWLLGDQMDATMNYRYRKAVLGFLINSTWTDNDNNGDQTMWKLSPSEFDYVLNSIREDYPEPSWYAMMNLMDSHDTNRALFVLRERSGDLPEAIAKMKMMAALQFTYPGVPTVYYGDEVGLGARDYGGYGTWGAGRPVSGNTQDDPYNRHPYPWTDEDGTRPEGLPNNDLLGTYQALGTARNNFAVLRTGDVVTLLADDTNNVYAYARVDDTGSDEDCAIAIFNRDTVEHDVTLTDLPAQCEGEFRDLFVAGSSYSTTGGADLNRGPSRANIAVNNVPGLTSVVLVPVVPTSVQLSGFTATAQDGQVLVAWETAQEVGNQGFNLYRATSANGPQTQLNTEGLIASEAPSSSEGFAYQWVDTDVEVGQTYYYWLETVATDGSTAQHGPASATVSTPTAITVSTLGTAPAPSRALLVALGGLATVAALGLLLRRR
ncbi:MAG TPA: alpha-glycosidase [Ardenticatenaceae bacterium]|jgi:glycosidase